jgi:deferrochelatase/peroxidase EfeB
MLPPLPGEILDPATSGGDIAVQACADDPQVAFHAIRNLARLGRGTVVTRWTQLGFGATSATGAQQPTPRNLMGFKDGTRNIRSDDAAALAQHVWVGDAGDPAWLRGGTYLVARRIRMFIEPWDRDTLGDQQAVIGRVKSTGAPLGGEAELDPPDFAATGPDGTPVIPADAHIRLAAFENNNGLRLLRRGYSFTDGIDPPRAPSTRSTSTFAMSAPECSPARRVWSGTATTGPARCWKDELPGDDRTVTWVLCPDRPSV